MKRGTLPNTPGFSSPSHGAVLRVKREATEGSGHSLWPTVNAQRVLGIDMNQKTKRTGIKGMVSSPPCVLHLIKLPQIVALTNPE